VFVHPVPVSFFLACEFFDFICDVDESLQGDTSIALELPDQKTRGFVVQIALPR
jgi:hypothetical protein